MPAATSQIHVQHAHVRQTLTRRLLPTNRLFSPSSSSIANFAPLPSSRACTACDPRGVYTSRNLSLSEIALDYGPVVSAFMVSPQFRNVCDAPQSPLRENMTSSTRPEVHNISYNASGGPSHGHRQHAQQIW